MEKTLITIIFIILTKEKKSHKIFPIFPLQKIEGEGSVQGCVKEGSDTFAETSKGFLSPAFTPHTS